MSTPDLAAAESAHHPTVPASELADYVEQSIRVKGTTGTLKAVSSGSMPTLLIKTSGNGFATSMTVDAAEPVELLDPQPEPDEEPVLTPIDVEVLRELMTVSDRRKALAGEEADLKAREAELSAKAVEMFMMNGMDSMVVDGRPVFLRTDTFPVYQQRGDGSKYTKEDAAAVLEQIGRGQQITRPHVNYQTMGSILREYLDAEEEVPAPLAEIVQLGEEVKVRVGAPRRKTRTRARAAGSRSGGD